MWYFIGIGIAQFVMGLALTKAPYPDETVKNGIVGSWAIAGGSCIVTGIGIAIFRGLFT